MGGCHFCTRWHFCTATFLHEVALLHGDSIARGDTFAWGDIFARWLFCMRGHFCTRWHFCTASLLHEGSLLHEVTFLHGDIFIRRNLCMASLLARCCNSIATFLQNGVDLVFMVLFKMYKRLKQKLKIAFFWN